MGSIGCVARTVFQLRTCCRFFSVCPGLMRKTDFTHSVAVHSAPHLEIKNSFPLESLQKLSKKHFVPNVIVSELWPTIEKEAILTVDTIDSHNFDETMMEFLSKCKLYDRGQSFLHYLNSVRAPNDITLAHFLILAAASGDEQKAFETYDRINNSPLVVPTVVELIIRGLSYTSRWKECFQMIGQFDEINVPSVMYLARAAFFNNDSDTGKKLIQHIMDSGIEPGNSDFSTWIHLLHSLKSNEDVYWLACQLLTCLRNTEHILTSINASSLRKALDRHLSMYGASVTMELNGSCPLCGYKLERRKFSPEEHKELKKAFESRLIEGNKTFEMSNPEELRTFMSFLEDSKPYDVVVDGLNVAYGENCKEPEKLAKQLLVVVTQLSEQGSKPLVVGRKHMCSWDKGTMAEVERKAKCFYATQVSSDDLLMIYATLYGGPGTHFVSKDLLREHGNLLMDRRKQELFKRWRKSSQVCFSDVNGKIKIQRYEQYGVYVQGNWKDGWHIPYKQYESYRTSVPFWKRRWYWMCANKNPHIRQPSRPAPQEDDLLQWKYFLSQSCKQNS